jgi:hypothetical protein
MKRFSYLTIFALLLVASCVKETPDAPEQQKVYPYASVSAENKNLPCGGVISTQYADSPNGSDIGKLVDNNVFTAFVTNHENFYVLWSGKKAFSLKSYTIVSASEGGNVPDSWVLSGSNDNKAWTQIDKKKGEVFESPNLKKEYKLTSTSSSFKYFKFVFSGSGTSAIAEIYLVDGTATSIDDLMLLSNGDTHSDWTPMGEFCENKHRTTASDLEWLSDATKEPTLPVEPDGLHWADCDVTLYPYGDPVPADVNQHVIGDCCALAVMASMAYQYPAFIKDIITDNANHTYTVKMYDPQGDPVNVTVSSKFLCNDDLNPGGVTGKHEVICWSGILEKAIMKWNSIYHTISLLDGIPTEFTAPLFTGNGDSFAFSSGVLDYEQMERAVTVLLNQGYLVIGGFAEDGKLIGDGPYKTVNAHAFTFLFDDSTDAIYGMRNPWGYANGSDPSDPHDGVAPIVNDGRTQPMIDLRVCHPGAAKAYKQSTLLPYAPPQW